MGQGVGQASENTGAFAMTLSTMELTNTGPLRRIAVCEDGTVLGVLLVDNVNQPMVRGDNRITPPRPAFPRLSVSEGVE